MRPPVDGTPENCLINTAYLEGSYLDSTAPAPVLCSSGFQTHKRFKIAMQPATVDGVANGAVGKPIDLVFNSTDDGKINRYQLFSKINNYTGMRLGGFKVIVGTTDSSGVFTPASTDPATDGQLFLTVGVGEEVGGDPLEATGGNVFDIPDMANFSHGLFGPQDQNFPEDGFFSATRAYFEVEQGCVTADETDPAVVDHCPPETVNVSGVDVLLDQTSDTISSSGAGLTTNYTDLFGAWLPDAWAPEGIFYDDDGDLTTDPLLVAWWNGSAWVKGQADNFVPVSTDEFNLWATNPLYSVDVIEDVLNLGLNYIVNVGDIHADVDGVPDTGSGQFTVRIIPVVAADQTVPAWVGTTPTPLEPIDTTPVTPVTPTTPVDTDDGDGGCVQNPNAPFNPTMPLLTLAAMGGLFWRLRRKRMN